MIVHSSIHLSTKPIFQFFYHKQKAEKLKKKPKQIKTQNQRQNKTQNTIATPSNVRNLIFGKNKTLLNKLYQLFNLYHYNHEEPYINIGINLNHLFKMLKSVKKRDSLDIFILKDAPNDLNIEIIRCRREGLFLGL